MATVKKGTRPGWFACRACGKRFRHERFWIKGRKFLTCSPECSHRLDMLRQQIRRWNSANGVPNRHYRRKSLPSGNLPEISRYD
jgi:hypothetical protein